MILCDTVKLVILHLKWMSTRSNIGQSRRMFSILRTNDYTFPFTLMSADLAFKPMFFLQIKNKRGFLFVGRLIHFSDVDKI